MLERLGQHVRFELTLTPREREIAILLVAEHEDSDFERYAHHRAAVRAGLSLEEIADLAAEAFAPRDAREGTLVHLVRTLLTGESLSDLDWRRTTDALGSTAAFEVVTLVGYYRMMALQLRAFAILPPPSSAPAASTAETVSGNVQNAD
ncbi:carboxymuconolactone decarboxylase family protein [Agrococcus versicolor]|uniref:carboxymuconolactone decarboxylase family protein n=1 Tax=Agrococcus versicolor TaxID=501482 RepID=UPI0031DF746D